MKCYFHHEQNCYSDYFKDPVLDGAVICAGDVPFQYNEWEGTYTEFVGNLISDVFVAANKNHEFLLSHKGKASNIPNGSNKFRKLNFVENCSNLIQITPTNPGDMSHPIYTARKRDDAYYLSRVKLALRTCVSDIDFVDPVDTRRVHEELMNQ